MELNVTPGSFPIAFTLLDDGEPTIAHGRSFASEFRKGRSYEIHGLAVTNDQFELLVAPKGKGIGHAEYVDIELIPDRVMEADIH
jgi:hypothetical protein